MKYPLEFDRLVELPEWLAKDAFAWVSIRRLQSQVEQSEDIRYYEKRFGTMRALRALTGTANEVFALTTYQNPYPKGKIGVLEAGSYADLLLVDGDPTKSVSVLADTDHLRLIMKGGTVYKNTLC